MITLMLLKSGRKKELVSAEVLLVFTKCCTHIFTSPLAVDLTVVNDLEGSCIESKLHVIIL